MKQVRLFPRPTLSAIILSVVILFCHLGSYADTWDGTKRSPAPSNSGNTYTINKCWELAWLADQVNAGNTFAGFTILIADNLNLNGQKWTPIGNSTYAFQGTFNGQGYTISNLLVNSANGYAGLFGNVAGNASISNCSTVSGSVTAATSHAGGLIGYMQGGTVSNCFSSCNVLSPGVASNAGGLIGTIFQPTSTPVILVNCYATGYVTCTGFGGGFAGSIDGVSPSYVTYIINCYATGPVLFYNYNTTTGGYGGGFTGNVGNKSEITNCFATGAIYGFTKNGGFVGSTNGNPSFIRCYFDIQGTGTTVGIGRGSGQDNQKYSLYGLSTAEITTPASISGYLDNTNYGSGVWTFTSGYYPELTNFKSGSSGYSLTSPTVTVPALTPSSEQKAWSSLSAVPLFFTDPDKSIIVANSIQAPLYANATPPTRINWYGAPRSGDAGLLSFDNSTGAILPAANGNYNFLTKDISNRTKPFFVHINKTMVYFVRSYNGLDGGTDANGIVHDGKTWAKAFRTVQYAVDKANIQTPKYAVWVAAGNYTNNPAYIFATGENFRIYDGVNVFGSFEEDSTQNNGYAGMDTRFASGYAVLNGGVTNTVLAPALNPLTTNTTWDGFYMKNSLSAAYAVNIPGRGWLMNAIIRGNVAGLQLQNGAKAINIVVANNSSTTTAALAMTDTAKLVNATIAYNKGPALAINKISNKPTIINSLLWGNNFNFVNAGDTSNITIKNSALSSAPDVGGSWVTLAASNNNIDLYHRSPNFKDPGKGNYDLMLISPCLDKGDPTQNTMATDIRGKDRLCYGSIPTIDIGAYQKQPNDGILVTGTNSLAYFRATLISPTITNLTKAEVLVNPGAVLDVSATSPTPKTLILQDNNINAPLIKGTMTADSILYVRTLKKFRSNGVTQIWNSFGIPFTSVRLDSIDGLKLENSVRIEQYTESTRSITGAYKQGWKPYLGTDFTTAALSYFTPGRGYMAQMNSKVPNTPATTVLIIPTKKGTVISDNPNILPIPLSHTSSPISWAEEGWNLIANPFYLTAVFAKNTGYWPSNSSFTPVYVYVPEIDNYNVVLFDNFNLNGLSAFSPCFVKTDVISQAQMQTSTLSSPIRVKRFNSEGLPASVFKLQLEDQKASHNAYVVFDSNTHANAIEGEDAPTFSNGSEALTISTHATGSQIPLSVNALPFTGTLMALPLTITVPEGGNYTLSLPENDKTTLVKLIDENGTSHSLNNSTFSVTANPGTTLNYTLLFDRTNTSNQTDNQTEATLSIVQNRQSITITSPTPIDQIVVSNFNGQTVQWFRKCGYQTQFNLPGAGSYILKITTDQAVITRKIIAQ